MKKIITLACLSFSFIIAIAQNNADQVTGLYWSPKKDARIEVYKKGDKYYGRSIWVANPRKDNQNPVAALRNRDVQGIELLTDFSFDDGKYSGGKIYDPESGKTYDCKMSLVGKDLKVRGYIGISLFGRTEIFERIKPGPLTQISMADELAKYKKLLDSGALTEEEYMSIKKKIFNKP